MPQNPNLSNHLSNYIAGEERPPNQGNYLENINPATGQLINLIPDSDASDIEDAVISAKAAFTQWSKTTAQTRSDFLMHIADGISSRIDEFALAETTDQGKPLTLSRSLDIPRAIENFRFFATSILHDSDSAYWQNHQLLSTTQRSAIGVCGLITPWNLPLYLLSWKIAPALAMGNTVVCKPSEFTSSTAALLAQVMNKATLPGGVCNFVFGTGHKAGEALVVHPDVPLISFTGGTATGKLIAKATAPLFKKTSFELGGKNPTIVFEDANIAKAAKTSVRAAFLNQGEICLCGSRVYVHRSIYHQFLEAFVAEVDKLVVGDPRAANTTIGALVSSAHRDKVESYIQLARDEGATLLRGAKRPKLSAPFDQGYFLEPTVITDLKETSRVQTEEIFGPVVTVAPFDSESEVLERANSNRYGLSAALFTENLSRAHRMAQALQVGTVWVNTWLARDLRVPFGGVKESGVGREGGKHSLDFYSEYKTIAMDFSSL